VRNVAIPMESDAMFVVVGGPTVRKAEVSAGEG
jgi:hypothetical protein